MLQLAYDGSMAGLLSAIFDAYARRAVGAAYIVKKNTTPDAFAQRVEVATDAVKASRVWKGLAKRLSADALDTFWYCYLSELPETENMLLSYARYAFAHPGKTEEDYGHPAVLWVSQTARKVWREKHRMEAFVRFRELTDGLFYALVEPDYNILPLIASHFQSRYADQSWLIYDGHRRYGLHYDRDSNAVQEVFIEWEDGGKGIPPDVLAPDEALYQMLWKDYFKSTGIPARRNPKLHMRHVPLRYWRHLIEKGL